MSPWQPIETAPKDGTTIDLWVAWCGRVTDAKWDARRNAWAEWAMDGFDRMDWVRVDGEPSHWMPLPPTPEVSHVG